MNTPISFVLCKHVIKYNVSVFSFLSRVLPTFSMYEKFATVSSLQYLKVPNDQHLECSKGSADWLSTLKISCFTQPATSKIGCTTVYSLKLLLTPTDVQYCFTRSDTSG